MILSEWQFWNEIGVSTLRLDDVPGQEFVTETPNLLAFSRDRRRLLAKYDPEWYVVYVNEELRDAGPDPIRLVRELPVGGIGDHITVFPIRETKYE